MSTHIKAQIISIAFLFVSCATPQEQLIDGYKAALYSSLSVTKKGDLPAPGSKNARPSHATCPEWRVLGSKALKNRRDRLTSGFIKHRLVHFTFDDGPHIEHTPLLLDALAEFDAKATFFVVGTQIGGPRSLERRALLQRIENDGHTVASHSFRHPNLQSLSNKQIVLELARAENVFQNTLGYLPGLFRPPFGSRNKRVDRVLRERGYAQILWNITPEASGMASVQSISRSFRRQLNRMDRHPRGPGGIVLLHDRNQASAESFGLLMEELERRNCEILENEIEGEEEELWDVANDLSLFLLYDEGIPSEIISERQSMIRAQTIESCAAGSVESGAIPSDTDETGDEDNAL